MTKEETDLHFKRNHALENANNIINKTINYIVFISVFNELNGSILAEFDYLANAEIVAEEIVNKYNNVKNGEHTNDFQKSIKSKSTQSNGPFFLLLVKNVDIPL